jgi:predicted nucleic acid-binding protein
MPLLLDSTVLIDFLRGRPATQKVDRLASAGEMLAVSPVNIEEVVRGLKAGESDSARRLFAGLEVLPLRQEEAWQSGLWRSQFAAKGVTLSQADCLVAATALLAGAKLATGNPAHFPMPELEVEHWPVGR